MAAIMPRILGAIDVRGGLEAISSLAGRELLAVAAVESSERRLALFRVACQELA
jgi:hypothetical protein